MNVIRGRQRRLDRWGSPHERARALAAERLDQQLPSDEEAWLERHLAECPGCAGVAADYARQQSELRALAGRSPEPPRDLWARTSAALDREAERSGRTRRARRTGSRRNRRLRPIPLGVLSGALVVALVAGVSLLPRRGVTQIVIEPSASPVASAVVPTDAVAKATPIPVSPDQVAWIRVGTDGRAEYVVADVDEVCQAPDTDACAPLDQAEGAPLALSSPSTVVKSPHSRALVVVGEESDGANTVVVVPVPSAGSEPIPTPTAASPSVGTFVSPSPASPAPTPTTSTPPATTATPAVPPSVSAEPTSSTEPTLTPEPATSDEPTPSVTVTPSPDGSFEIATDVTVVGDTPAYSPDGRWFAFSARPADGSHGPDVYLWREGDTEARVVTTDHRSVFAAWYDGHLLASRAVAPEASATPSASPGASAASSPAPLGVEFRAESFLIDPETGAEASATPLPFWRPAVDPRGQFVVYWDGTVARDPETGAWRPATGRLVLGSWPAFPPVVTRADASRAVAWPVALPAAAAATDRVIATGPLAQWDARWSPAGTRLAVWLGDATHPEVGHLHLFAVDPPSGPNPANATHLIDVPAAPGFSITDERLAWATPPGQDGEGSRIQVVAWKGDQLGSVETAPGDDPLLIIR